MIDESAIRLRYEALAPVLDERGRRRFAAAEARRRGVAGSCGCAHHGYRAQHDRPWTGRIARRRAGARSERVRRTGGGRRPLSETDASLLDDLADWSSRRRAAIRKAPLLWTAKSLRKLAAGLRELGHRDRPQRGRRSAARARLQPAGQPQDPRRDRNHPDRDAQFGYINDQVKQALAAGEPAISVDTKKKELVGDFKNAGREWRPKGQPEEVRVHDFLIPELGRAAPYGVYDIADNAGWVSVGIDHDTASFAVNAIRRWWQADGARALSRRHAAC